MLRGIIIAPDTDLIERLGILLDEIGIVSITKTLDQYPNQVALLRLIRTHAPQVIFLSTESAVKAIEIARLAEKNAPGTQFVAVNRFSDPQTMLEIMRAGIREFASLPFDRQSLMEGLARINETTKAQLRTDCTSHVFSFLPAKPGVGASTIAMNVAVALSRLQDTQVLLTDFDLSCGMVRFLLELDNAYCVTDACRRSLDMNATLWRTMVTARGKLDLLHSGKPNPNIYIEATEVRQLMEFARRNYNALCFDMSGNLESYSLEIVRQSRYIFLVCTPETPVLQLAHEKYLYLKQLDLDARVKLVVNRSEKKPLISPEQIEELMEVPIFATLSNDYQEVQRAIGSSTSVEQTSDLGKQFVKLAQTCLEDESAPRVEPKKKFLDFFLARKQKPAVASGMTKSVC